MEVRQWLLVMLAMLESTTTRPNVLIMWFETRALSVTHWTAVRLFWHLKQHPIAPFVGCLRVWRQT